MQYFTKLVTELSCQYWDYTAPVYTIYGNGVYDMGIKAFNHLPSYIKELSDDKIQFKNILNNYLLSNSFYSLKNFLMVNFDVNVIICAFNWTNM
jgi:hypothetical protein